MNGVRHRHTKGVENGGEHIQADTRTDIQTDTQTDAQADTQSDVRENGDVNSARTTEQSGDILKKSPSTTSLRRSSSLNDDDRPKTKSRKRHHSSHETESALAGLIAGSRHLVEEAEDLMKKFVIAGWQLAYHHTLPKWLQDNEYIVTGHRRPLNSFRSCFSSVFRIHSETGNIWTHLLGMIAFILIAVYTLGSRYMDFMWQDITVHSVFFAGAITCLTLSWVYHTVFCHSESVLILFGKLDYCGIAFLTVGSFVPWLYYGFYYRPVAHIIYLVSIVVLGTSCVVVTLRDEFSSPAYRPLRVGLFISLGLTGVVPAFHFYLLEGWTRAIDYGLGHLVLMAVLYISGALMYGFRIPESIYPGKFDLWCQSHQIFHVCVILAALVHFRGIQIISGARLNNTGNSDIM